MSLLKNGIVIVGTLIGAAITYETTLVGARALGSDIKYLKECKNPPVKKHWWSRKKVKR